MSASQTCRLAQASSNGHRRDSWRTCGHGPLEVGHHRLLLGSSESTECHSLTTCPEMGAKPVLVSKCHCPGGSLQKKTGADVMNDDDFSVTMKSSLQRREAWPGLWSSRATASLRVQRRNMDAGWLRACASVASSLHAGEAAAILDRTTKPHWLKAEPQVSFNRRWG